MGEGERIDPRQVRRAFQAVSEGSRRFDSVEELLSFFLAPFRDLFGEEALPNNLRAFAKSTTATCPYSSVQASCSSTRIDDPVNTASTPETANVDVLLIEAIQTALLSRVVVDWSHALDPTQLSDLINLYCFAPHLQQTCQGTIQQCSLRTTTRLLSATVHPTTLHHLEQLCIRAVTHLSLPAVISSVQAERNRARADVAWKETLRLMGSMPDRLANAMQGKLARGFTGDWVEGVLVRGVVRCLSMSKVPAKYLKQVLERLDKLGYLTQAADADGKGFWSSFFRFTLEHQIAAQGWKVLRARLGARLRVKLDESLVETVQHLILWKGGGELVSARERGRPGSEGSMFLSKHTQASVAAIARIFDTLLTSSLHSQDDSSDSSFDSGSGSDADDGDGDHESRIVAEFNRIALSCTLPQSPTLAWSWSTFLQRFPASLETCLESTLEVWSDSTRIKRSMMHQEAFLSTLVVCLLSSTSTDDDAGRLYAIARSPAVLNGVSAHLEHSDPTMRRMGMLVAELLSAKTATEGSKTLKFGSAMWNGLGEGREEARVLRALSDAWAVHADAITQIGNEWKEGDGFVEAVRVLGVGSGGTEDEEKAADVKGDKAKVKKPKVATRRLPERVEPPARHSKAKSGGSARPLITMLDSDDDVDGTASTAVQEPHSSIPHLQMFARSATSTPQRKAAISSSSADSSSDSDSDSDVAGDNGDPDSIHRIAASLSGLSTTEASSILNASPLTPQPPPSSSHRSSKRSDPTDFSHDPESHAPQFHTKTAPPVYISQLSPLLRSSTRSSIRTALHHAVALIRRKASPAFGAELRENAVDLALSLVALHDNFSIRGFERMRSEALVELACAEPALVVAVVAEQCLGAQWSDVQRVAMWAAIGESAVRLAGGLEAGEANVGERAEKVISEVIGKARAAGEESVPAIRRDKSLSVTTATATPTAAAAAAAAARTRLVEPYTPTAASQAVSTRQSSAWSNLAGPTYVFPLLNRVLAHQTHHASLATRAYRGAGTTALFQPSTFALLLDTLTLLVSLSPQRVVDDATPMLLQLLASSLAASVGTSIQTASSLSLLALVLDRMLDSHTASPITDRASIDTLRWLLEYTQGVFTTLQSGLPGQAQRGNAGLQGKIVARAAAVLLLMDRWEKKREDEVRRLIGFVPS